MPTVTKIAPPGDQTRQADSPVSLSRVGTPHHPWTADDDARLAAMWPDHPRAEIAAALGRSVSSILYRARARGLGRPRQYGPRGRQRNALSTRAPARSSTQIDERHPPALATPAPTSGQAIPAPPPPSPQPEPDASALGDLVTAVRRVYEDQAALLARAVRAEHERDRLAGLSADEALTRQAISHRGSAVREPGDGRDHPQTAHQDAAQAPVGAPIAASTEEMDGPDGPLHPGSPPVESLRLQLHRCLHDLARERARVSRLSILLAYQREALSDTHALRALGISNAQLLDELSAVTHAGIAAAARAVARRPPEDTRRTPG